MTSRLSTLLSLPRTRRSLSELVAAGRSRRLGPYLDGVARGRHQLARYRAERQPEPTVEHIVMREGGGGAPSLEHVQFAFASRVIAQQRPGLIHDIGSHRGWVLGVGAAFPIVSLDVREPVIRLDSERFTPGRAEALPWATASVECLVSLHSIEHFGLGAYQDELEPDGDRMAAREMTRVVKPGGSLILTTTVTGGASFTVFNVHRVYDRPSLNRMFEGFYIVDEQLFSTAERRFISAAELRTDIGPYCWDLYLLHARRKDGA